MPEFKMGDSLPKISSAKSGLRYAESPNDRSPNDRSPNDRSPNDSDRVRLCLLCDADAAETAELLARSTDFHRNWVTYPTDLDQVAAFIAHPGDDGMMVFGVRRRSDNVLVGIATLCRIAREPWLTAECGAAVDVRQCGNGYMAEGMRLLVRFAVEELGLHRVEALVRPENVASARMLTSAGFRIEGIARGAIRIQDDWVDHMRWAAIAEDLPTIQRHIPVEERG